MKSILGLILFAAVVSFDISAGAADSATTSLVVGGTASITDCYNPNLDKARSDQCINDFRTMDLRNKCSDLLSKMTKAANDAKAACKAANIQGTKQECMDRADECAEIANNGEAEVETNDTGSIVNMLASMTGSNFSLPNQTQQVDPDTVKGYCFDTKQNYDDELKSIKDELKENDKEIKDLQGDIADAKKDAEQERNDAAEEALKFSTEAQDEDRKEAEDKRSQDADLNKAQAEAKSQVSSLNLEVITAQGTLSKAIGDRTRALLQLTDAMINKKCRDLILDERQKKGAMKYGSSSGLFQNRARSKSDEALIYADCLKESQALREETRQAADANIDMLNATIDQKMEQSKDIQKGLSLAQSQQTQRDAETEQIKQQRAQQRQMKMANINQNATTNQQTSTEKIQSFQKRLDEVNRDKNNSATRLKLLKNTPIGSKSPKEAVTALTEFESAQTECMKQCAGSDDQKIAHTCDVDDTFFTKKATSATGSTPDAGAPGTKGTDGQ